MNRRIVIDTREQRPYSFSEMESITHALPAGDYSLEGLESRFAIERKSLADWISTVLRARRRFSVELKKLQTYEFAAVVIDASIEDILSGNYRSDIKPASLLGLTAGLMQSYSPVHFLFAGSRPHAHALAAELLKLGGERVWQ